MTLVLLRYLLLYVSMSFGIIGISQFLNKSICKSIILYIFISMLALYICGLLNCLLIGVWAIFIASFVLGIASIVKTKGTVLKKLKTPVWIMYTLMYVFFIINTYSKTSNCWDEFSFWGLSSKLMFYNNKFAILTGTNLPAMYPPFPTIWLYYVEKIIGEYSQGIEFFATYILVTALLLPIFEKVSKKNVINNILIIVSIICIPSVFSSMFYYDAIYADALLGLLIGYVFINIYKYEKNKSSSILEIILGLIFLSMTKGTGIVIAGIIVGMWILFLLIKKQEKSTRINKKNIINILVSILAILLIFGTWQIEKRNYVSVDYQKIENSKEEKIVFDDVIEGFISTVLFRTGYESENVQNVIKINVNLLESLRNMKSITNFGGISIINTILISMIAIYILYKRCISIEEKNIFKKFNMIMYIGLFLYIVSLQMAYYFVFGLGDALIHNSFLRYVNPYLLGMFIVNLTIYINNLKENTNNTGKLVILTIFIVLLTPLDVIEKATVTGSVVNYQIQKNNQQYIDKSDKIRKVIDGEKTCIINQSYDGSTEELKLKYYLVPNVNLISIDKIDTKAKFRNLLRDNDYKYIYIVDLDEEFLNKISDLFFTEEKSSTLYKIQTEENQISLVEVDLY